MIENSKIHIDKFEKDTPPEAVLLSQKLYKMMPRIKLPDLLLEVSKWTDFDRNFTPASSGNVAKSEERTILMAALMAMGTNIGLPKMADSTLGISYRQMANTAQWRLYDDALKKAQSALANYHHKLFLATFWVMVALDPVMACVLKLEYLPYMLTLIHIMELVKVLPCIDL